MPLNLRNPAALGAALAGDLENARIASTPGGIVAQEAAGQRMLVGNGALLPRRINSYPQVVWSQVEAATGIVRGKDHDDLFAEVTLPEGWHLVPTNHNMWSDLVDAKGGKRASIFFKAAFYDRSAYLSFNSRYVVMVKYNDDTGVRSVYVLDQQTGQKVQELGECSTKADAYQEYDRLQTKGNEWLEANYPDHRNPFAYWE